MIIGAMNHPAHDVIAEIRWIGEFGLEFIDLTLEPPGASSWRVNARDIAQALKDHGLKVVGHTAYYLPMASPFEGVRRAAVEEFKRCLDIFSTLGARWMNMHPQAYAPMHDRSYIIERNIATITDLLPMARDCGVGLMIENLPGDWNNVLQLSQLLDPLPELGLHLDIGHANLQVARNTTDEILRAYGSRLRHVHLHDNKGGQHDLHLPLGCGNLDVRHTISLLKRSGYDGTITLEVFSEDKHYLLHSRDVLRETWDCAPDGPAQGKSLAVTSSAV
ncbi:MAG TPA: sugar phosphate isomerase/epimerase family protein [Candidatus Acidoferrum sp.]|nr:sugar phosphate isomerase/epimerase family protein [Candidatus Acidoferrum sp.]